jgi:hypothetical protein
MTPPTPKPGPADGSPDPRVFHKYLRDRYAECVVLTFGEIEDLLGSALPAAARLHTTWWTDAAESDATSLSHAWVKANRSALPNLLAGNVRFDRLTV